MLKGVTILKPKLVPGQISFAVMLMTVIPSQAVPNFNNVEEPAQPVAIAVAEKVEEEPQVEKVEAKPVVKPVAKPKPVVHPTGCENYRQLVQSYFGAKAGIALKIAQAESGCNPRAVGDDYPINGLYAPSCGLFQVRTLQGRPNCEALKNPQTNVDWAYRIYLSEGWGAWSVCRTKVSCY